MRRENYRRSTKQKGGRKKGARDEDGNVPANEQVTTDKQTHEHGRKGQECVDMEERHRRV